ncbi:24211_t:CDS:2, partial [Dentiscutata erythropus]
IKRYLHIAKIETKTSQLPWYSKIEPLATHIQKVYHLISQLPKSKAFDIYMDNFFTSINLFSYMRKNGYGGCGTVRTNTSKFPTCLKLKKSQKLEWDTLSGVVVDDVLAVFWMDNGPVTMLTTIHEVLGE